MSRRFEPTAENRADVLKMAARGVPHPTIGTIIGCDAKTLVKYFKAELDLGRARCTNDYVGTLYELANIEKIPAAVFFYLKTREGYRETATPQQEPQRTQLVLNKGATRHSKQVLAESEKKDGTND